MSAEQNNDPLIRQLREQISDADRTIVEAVNVRLKLVSRLKDYKESRGMSFVDPEREEWMLNYLTRANRGPLSAEGNARGHLPASGVLAVLDQAWPRP